MDFGTLLHVAQKKTENSKSDIKYYSTKFEPPKKEERNKRQLSANIQKFLARKEAEEKQKAEEARIRKLELLALRSQDRKAKKRVQCMLQRTKSANKSVIDDAVDNKDTAVTLAGPSQPDEDDYGYESQESAAIYAKMMERYSAMPEEEKFSESKKKPVSTNLNSTKERVKAALLKEEEEANMPHKRKRKSKSSDDSSASRSNDSSSTRVDDGEEMEKSKTPEKPKPKKPPPPIMNFSDLLKIAEKKQYEPIVIEPKVVEEEQLLTKKQKKEMEKERAWRESREARLRAALTAPPKSKPEKTLNKPNSVSERASASMPPPSTNKMPKFNNTERNLKQNNIERRPMEPRGSAPSAKIPKLGSGKPPSSTNDVRPEKNSSRNLVEKKSEQNIKKLPSNGNIRDQSKSKPLDTRGRDSEQKQRQYLPGDMRHKQQQQDKPKQYLPGDLRHKAEESKPRQYLPGDLRYKQQQEASPPPRQYLPGDLRYKQQQEASKSKPTNLQSKDQLKASTSSKSNSSNSLKPKQFPPNDLKPKQFPPNDLKPKQFPPNDLRPKQFPPSDLKPKQFPPADVRSKQFPSRDVKRKPPPRRPIIEDDSEYDSEMDDFIDDGPLGGEEDYSKHIKEIFGYDKSRYQNYDDEDDSAMEAKFSTILKEEYISTKIGILEDLEDMRKEAEEKKRKALMKKKMKR